MKQKEKPTICWITENYPPSKGGMARSCDRIVSTLREHYTIHLFHFTNKQEPYKITQQLGGSYTAIPVFEDNSHSLNVLWAFFENDTRVQKTNILVSFGSNLCLKGIPVMAKWLEKPYLLCFRGNDFDSAIFSTKKQDLLFAIEHAAAIACVSKEKQLRILKLNLNNSVYFTPNSIDAEQWQVSLADTKLSNSIKTDLPINGKKIIGLVGFLKQKKGIDFFINGLLKSPLMGNVHLRFIGEIEAHLEAALTSRNISYSIVAPTSKTSLIANYLMCNCIAIPSIYDGMPNVLFEAGILGIPIIAAKTGGIPDVLDQNNAFLFKVLSEIELLEALTNFANSSTAELIELTNKLKTKLLNQFNLESETNNYLSIINNIIKK